MNARAVVFGLVVLMLAVVLMFYGGWFMHGDPVDSGPLLTRSHRTDAIGERRLSVSLASGLAELGPVRERRAAPGLSARSAIATLSPRWASE